MPKKSVDHVDVRGRRVLVRLDLNVPLDEQGCITDDRRIRAALPTLRKLIDGGGRLILMSHLGRPVGDPEKDKRYSLRPVAARLGELFARPVAFIGSTIGPDVRSAVDALTDGDCCLLENLRFHKAETIKDKNAATDPTLRETKEVFASRLADLADIYVNDAFGTCHRDNASMLTVPQKMSDRPKVLGYLVERELRFLGDALTRPKRPFVVVLGGAKVSDKVATINALIDKCDTILVGGAMAYTFAAAHGIAVGNSLVEPDRFETAEMIRRRAGDKLRLPIDSVAAREIDTHAETKICSGPIDDGWMGLDIGPQTIAAFRDALQTASTIFWNGPMGVFETPPFDQGTCAVASSVADATDRGAVSVVGGGDSAAAIDRAGVADRITHVSTGGGASIEFLEGKHFATIDVLDDV